MRFVNPLFLIGLAAAMLPVLIHLLTRDRIRRVSFSTLRFFAGTSPRVLRRKRFQEAILLAMRMAVCGLLAAAFARPFFARKSDEPGGETATVARVIVADISGSVGRLDGEALAKACRQAMGDLAEGTDAAGLIVFADGPVVSAPLSRQFAELKTQLAALSPGQGGTNIHAALKAADEMLRNARAKQKEIVLISDLQKVGWSGGDAAAGQWKLAADVKLSVRSLAPAGGILPHADLAIIDRYCPQSLVLDDSPQTIAVKVANYSTSAQGDVPVTLEVRGQAVATRKVNLPAGGPLSPASIPVQFGYVFNTAGDNPVVVRVGGGERTAVNTAYFSVRVMERIPVVILNGAPSANPETDPAFFLGVALSPKGAPPFAVRTIEAAAAKPEEVRGAAVVVLASVARLPAGVVDAVRELVEKGGGVLFLPGDLSADAFNNAFAAEGAALSPCRLRKTPLSADPVPGEVGGVSLMKIDYEHPALKKFSLPHAGDFSLTRFFRWWEVGDHQGDTTKVLARFEDGRPALLERPTGRGVSMLLASAVESRWSNIAGRAIFAPLVHEIAKHLAVRAEQSTAYAVGQRLPVPAGMKMNGPDGKAMDENAVANVPGHYVAVDREGKPAFCFAVNADAAEADPATVAPDEMAAAVRRSAEEVAAAQSDSAEAAGLRRAAESSGLWWYVAVAVGMLFMMELFVANRTLRH